MNEFVILGGLAFADAINPTTLGISLYLLTHHNYPHKVLVFTLGVFITYFTFGLVLEAGFDKYLTNLLGEQHPVFVTINFLIGATIILYGFVLGKKPRKRRKGLQQKSAVSVHSAFALGGLATVMDLPTAFPYLGAITIIGSLGNDLSEAATILLAYNLIVVLPILTLLMIRVFLHKRSEAVIKKIRIKIFKWERPLLRFTLVIMGTLFLLNAFRTFL